MKKNKHFSDETRELLGISQDVALELGYENITPLHFFLADYILNGQYSTRGLVFKDNEEFQKFYDTQRISEAIIFPDTSDGILQLSVEAKLAIKNSLREIKKHAHRKVQPFHLFLAISEFDNSFLSNILSQRESLYLTLIEYYKKAGYISDEQKQSSIISKIKNSLRVFKLDK